MQQNDSRNTIIFMAIAIAMFFGYNEFVLKPQQVEARRIAAADKAQAAKEAAIAARSTDKPGAVVLKSREAAKAVDPRLAIRTGTAMGSINLRGGRVDDLYLTERGPKGSYRYAETMAKDSPPVELLRPKGSPQHAWYAEFGWRDPAGQGLIGEDTLWTAQAGSVLTPTTPVVLTHAAPGGLLFTRTISVDDKYMFTVSDTVANTSAGALSLAPYAIIQRSGLPVEHGKKASNVFEGAIGWLSDADKGSELRMRKYKDLKKKEAQSFASTGGWLGITDKYWLAAVIPNPSEKIATQFSASTVGTTDTYGAGYSGSARVVAPGQKVTETTRLFAGPKVVNDLKAYQKGYKGAPAVAAFDRAVDWGVLSFLTKPFFIVLEWIFSHVGNFGIAILAMTLLVRVILFPLAHKSYESMSRMKKLQKPMEELRAKYKDDPTKMQQETMALYQREKVNPMVGCLPILLQIPIFLAFYKVLSVTIEMRHAPFFGYLRDLSERDPVTVLNLFGLIPWNPATVPLIGGFLDTTLHLGPLALLYGFTMWLTTAMNPPAPDPMQQRIFSLMPILFTFIMAGFPAGLLIYWTFSNVFSIFQQYIIMHRLKVENPIDQFIGRLRGEEKAAT